MSNSRHYLHGIFDFTLMAAKSSSFLARLFHIVLSLHLKLFNRNNI